VANLSLKSLLVLEIFVVDLASSIACYHIVTISHVSLDNLLIINAANGDEGGIEFALLQVGRRAASRHRRIVAVLVVEGAATRVIMSLSNIKLFWKREECVV